MTRIHSTTTRRKVVEQEHESIRAEPRRAYEIPASPNNNNNNNKSVHRTLIRATPN
jgi:hypothetical protein